MYQDLAKRDFLRKSKLTPFEIATYAFVIVYFTGHLIAYLIK
jgi:hypothetical protein